MEASVASLRIAAAHGRPLTPAGARLMEVPEPLVPLFPEGGIRRGIIMAVGPLSGGCSLSLALAGTLTGRGGWAAAVGMPSLGLVAAAELGVDLRRLALVPDPGGHWPAVVAALVDGFDLILLRPLARVRPADARRLAARVRERGAVMVVVGTPGWPESADIRLSAGPSVWEGLGAGHGLLQARRMEVVAAGRRIGGRERRRWIWLPAPGGGLAAAAGDPVAGGSADVRLEAVDRPPSPVALEVAG